MSHLKRTLPLLTTLMSVPACSDTAPTAPNPEANFPKRFLWGAAVAGFQSDPGCPTLAPEACEDRASDWYQWVSDPDVVANPSAHVTGEPLANGPGMRELFASDLALAKKELHHNAIRLSIEWSRLFPDAEAETANSVDELEAFVNPDGLAYYEALFDEIKRLGLKPLVTLNHYTLPLWIHDGKACNRDLATCEDKGWVDGPRITRAIALYAGYCARQFGDRVDLWATLNEPFATVLAGYVLPSAERSHPPGVTFQIDAALDVLVHQIEGHARMVDAVRAEDRTDADGDGEASRCGTVVNIAAFVPADPSDPMGPDAARHASWVHNELFLEGVAHGKLDLDVDGVLETDRPDLKDRIDWIGVNYYTRLSVSPLPSPLAEGKPWLDFLPSVDGGFFQVYPEGLHESLVLASRFGKPLIVTENGTPNLTDDSAETFLLPHLRQLWRALEEGIPVEGYFFWTLVDNYEWNHGMNLKLGLYALDPATKGRVQRPIASRYAEIVRARGF
jgi:beta-galactosidase